MGEKNLWSKLGLVVLLVGMSAWAVWPPDQKLKPGIDLGGGHSLLFEVDDSGLDASQRTELASKVMAILKQRVDPGSNRNLVWRPIGWNRIEIQMPKAPESQSKYRAKYEDARAVLIALSMTETQIRGALTLPADQRKESFARMAGPITARKVLFEKLAALEDEYRQLQATASQPVEGEIARKIDEKFLARRAAIEDLLKTNLDVRVLGDILQLDKKSKVRAEKITAIKNSHPDLVNLIDDMVAGNDEWAKVKGALDDPSDLMRLLRGAGKLEFRILAQRESGNPGRTSANDPKYREEIKKYTDQLTKYGPRPREGDNFQWFKIDKPDENDITKGPYIVGDYLDTKYVLSHSTSDMGLINDGQDNWKLRGAFEGQDRQGRPAVNFELDTRGGAKFGTLTRNNLQKPLCIFLDNGAMSSATIQSEITTNGQISGNFSREDVARLINTLNAGVLPARLKEVPLQQKSVGPALGKTNRDQGLRAGMVALLLTVVFMAVYYNYNGIIADIAVLLNMVITLGIMAFMQATFTLPGIAGLVLTLGMAVDANVLIFERMREELARGVSARMAAKLGYEKAFSAILDGNVTTIITAIILGSLGSEEIKGFGLTLGLGLATSMFTALFVTRQYFHVMIPTTLNREETRRAWTGTGSLLVIGALFMGLGFLFNTSPEQRADSAFLGFGKFFLVMFATAAVLMLSLWGFRIMYRVVGHQHANRLPMMKLWATPKIDWMGKYKTFWTVSGIIILSGLAFIASVDTDQYMDIEFLGGTSVQLEIRQSHAAEFAEKGDEKLLGYIRGNSPAEENDPSTSVGWLRFAADKIANATVTSQEQDDRYLVSADGFNPAQMEALLLPTIEDLIVRGGIKAVENGFVVQFNSDKIKDVITDATSAQDKIRGAAGYVRGAANKLRNSRVQMVEEETTGGKLRKAFEIITTETQRSLVAEALLASMGKSKADILEVTVPIHARLFTSLDRAPDGLFPIKQSDNTLSEVIGGDSGESIADFKGGVAFILDELQPAPTTGEVQQRLREMRLQPDFEEIGSREKVKVFGLDALPGTAAAGEPRFKRVAIAVSEPALPYVEGGDNELWRTEVAQKELALAQAAMASSRSLQRVTQFAAQIAGEAVQMAIIAIVLSLIAMAIYVWVRFSSLDFGLAGIIALYHDVAVALACTMACHHLYNTPIGRLLMLNDFKIDLSVIAALLSIVGFSINDTIVIFDRVRENRGRLAVASPSLINNSINQTLSRTIITSFTVLMTVIAMYVFGGEGIHAFSFVMLVGLISGTYSTLAIASPLLSHPRALWVITIVLSALTGALIVSLVAVHWVRYILLAIIVAIAVVAFIKQWAATAGEPVRATASA